jgi:hypothetical protein
MQRYTDRVEALRANEVNILLGYVALTISLPEFFGAGWAD